MKDDAKLAVGFDFASGVLGLAPGAVQGDPSIKHVPLKDDFDILVKTGLAYVVRWLRQSLVPFVAELGSIDSVNEGSKSEFDKRMTPAVRDEFLHCAQLLQGLEVALLQLAHLETVSEESFLSLQNLLIHLRNFKGYHIAVADADHRGTDILSGNKSANR